MGLSVRPRTAIVLVIAVVASVVVGISAYALLQQFFVGSLLPGEQALELLQASPYPHLVLEVDYTPGENLTAGALALLEARLSTYTAKETIETEFEVIEVDTTSLTTADLVEIEQANRDRVTGGDTFALYILSISGEPVLVDQIGTTLGAAYSASSLVLFKEVVRNLTTGPGPSLADVESSVLVHEIGHIMGLVNLVYLSDMDYEDMEHPFHSTNNTDVMFWAIESAFFAQPPSDFGFETRYDLQKLQAGEYTISPSRLRELWPVHHPDSGMELRWTVSVAIFRWVSP